MQIHNMLESNGKGVGYQAGNIRLVKIKAELIEVIKRNGEIIKYQRIEGDIHRAANSQTETSRILR